MCLRILKGPVIGALNFLLCNLKCITTIQLPESPGHLLASQWLANMSGFVFLFVLHRITRGESYKIISSQTECSFYQILYSHYYLYTILSTCYLDWFQTKILFLPLKQNIKLICLGSYPEHHLHDVIWSIPWCCFPINNYQASPGYAACPFIL